MQVNYTKKLNHMLKKSIISMAMLGAVALALASSGGGDKKKATVSSGAKTVKSTPGYSLKAGRSYTNALTVNNRQNNNFTLNNTIVTYRKGNTIYIQPSMAKVTKPVSSCNNLNLLKLKVPLRNK
jgi:ABC-type oligopeptide transport system substrate-binding subunit